MICYSLYLDFFITPNFYVFPYFRVGAFWGKSSGQLSTRNWSLY